MIAKGLLLFCLVGLSCATFLKKRQLATVVQPLPTLQHTLYKTEFPEIHEHLAQPVVHKVHQNVHVERYIQPVVHHIYRQPLLKQTVETPVIPAEPVVQPLPLATENNLNLLTQAQAQAQVAL